MTCPNAKATAKKNVLYAQRKETRKTKPFLASATPVRGYVANEKQMIKYPFNKRKNAATPIRSGARSR